MPPSKSGPFKNYLTDMSVLSTYTVRY